MAKKFYHLHKIGNDDDKWVVGNVLEAGKAYNKFYEFSLNFEPKIKVNGNKWYPFANVCNIEKSLIGRSELLNRALCLIDEYGLLVREIGLEEVRKEKYPHLPSRQKCIWLCKAKQLEYWKKNILSEYEIYEIEVYGQCFKSQSTLLPFSSDSYNTILKKANLYWNSSKNVEREDDEFLYTGKFKIIRKIAK